MIFFQDRIFGASRHFGWRLFRKEHIKKACEVCGKKFFLELHHILPVHLFPKKELDEDNVVTLCRKHHLEWGHLFSFRSYNLHIKQWIKEKNERP